MKILSRREISEFQSQRDELSKQIKVLNEKIQKQEEFIDKVYDHFDSNTMSLKPSWRMFIDFILLQGIEALSDQFSVTEKEDKGIYLISFCLRNGRLNSYSKGRGANGLLSRWNEYRIGFNPDHFSFSMNNPVPELSPLEQLDVQEEILLEEDFQENRPS